MAPDARPPGMKTRGLDTIKVDVTRKSKKLTVNFTGSEEQVKQAQKIYADWT